MSDVIIPDGFVVKATKNGTVLLLMDANRTAETDGVYAAVYANHPDALQELVRRFEKLPEVARKRHE